MAKLLADRKDIVRSAGLENVFELRTKVLQLSDRLANEVTQLGYRIAATEGGITGAIGLPECCRRSQHNYSGLKDHPQDRDFVYGFDMQTMKTASLSTGSCQ
jgi:hypothetical protein